MFRTNLRAPLAALLGALAIGVTLISPASAAPPVTTVTQVITGGSLTASISSATLTSVVYSNTQHTNTGALSLSVSDARGTSQGWNVTVGSTNFVYQVGGPSANPSNIPATGFSVAPDAPVMSAGQALDGTHGPKAGTGASLDSAVKVISADSGYGSGDYTQNLPVSLIIPAQSQTGTYVATLTVSVTTGP